MLPSRKACGQTDFSYWEKLKAFIDYEPVEAIAPEVRGILASIGIIKGVPFSPDAQARQILTRAVETAPKMIYAARVAGEPITPTDTTQTGST